MKQEKQGRGRIGLIALLLGGLLLGAGLIFTGTGLISEEKPEGQKLLYLETGSDSGQLQVELLTCRQLSAAEPDRATINLLLIGQDRKPEEQGSRSDSMILCTICPETDTMTITSILRDLYVEIPGYGKNRVNASYSFGGRELLKQTLENNLGIQVQGCIEVDFSQFAGLMDLLGGVPMELREDEAKEINRALPGSDLHKGTCILRGDQALAYSRIRALDGDADVSRTQRQRKVLEVMFRQYQKASSETLISLLRQAIPMMTTDLSMGQIFSYAGILLPRMKNLHVVGRRIPADGTYRDLNVRGMAVLEADLGKNRQILERIQAGRDQ